MQNKHLEHPEDVILTGDLTVLDWFVNAGTLSVKVDGAPAIVWGIDPANGEFFVGTKAVFREPILAELLVELAEAVEAAVGSNLAQ